MSRRPRATDAVTLEARKIVRLFGDSADSVVSGLRRDVQGAEGFERFARLDAEVIAEIEYQVGR